MRTRMSMSSKEVHHIPSNPSASAGVVNVSHSLFANVFLKCFLVNYWVQNVKDLQLEHLTRSNVSLSVFLDLTELGNEIGRLGLQTCPYRTWIGRVTRRRCHRLSA